MEDILFNYLSTFMTLSEAEKSAILALDIFKTYKKGTILLREGHRSTQGYFVIKGCIRCYYILDGDEKTTAFYTESQSLTPLCSISREPSAHYVSCVEDSILIVSTPDMEKIIFEQFPRFETLCRLLAEQLLGQNQASFDDFKTTAPEQRYLKLLKTNPGLVQRVPQYQMASFLGIKPQSLSRLRSRLAKKGQ